MSELINETTPEAKLYPGVINDTIERALGVEALFSAFNSVLDEEEE